MRAKVQKNKNVPKSKMSSEVSKGFKGSETCQGWPPWANGVMPRHQDLDPGIPRAVNAVKSVAEVGSTHKEQE